ncbi:hypothetical protein ACQR07_16215 [Bradyrhizobium sp. HKCCYLS20291]
MRATADEVVRQTRGRALPGMPLSAKFREFLPITARDNHRGRNDMIRIID